MPPIPYLLGLFVLFVGCVLLTREGDLRDFSRQFLLAIGATAIGVFGGLHATQAAMETANRARTSVLISRTEVRLELLETQLRVLDEAPKQGPAPHAYVERMHNPLTRLFQDEEIERLLPQGVISDQLFYESEFIRMHLMTLTLRPDENTLHELRDCVLLSHALVRIAAKVVDERDVIWETPVLDALRKRGRSAAIQVAREQQDTQRKFRQMLERLDKETDP